MQKRQGLEQTNRPAIEVSQSNGIFGCQGQQVGGEGCRENPVGGAYASASAQSWEQRNPSSWSVQWLLYSKRPPVSTWYWSGKKGKKQ